jgi:hypothetical protein
MNRLIDYHNMICTFSVISTYFAFIYFNKYRLVSNNQKPNASLYLNHSVCL